MVESARFEALIEEIDRTQVGVEERNLIEQAVRLAEELGADELAYRARVRLTASAYMTHDMDAMLASFAWCAGQHAADPQRFPALLGDNPHAPGLNLLLQYNWAAKVLTWIPAIALTEVYRCLDEMAERYARAGMSPRTAVFARFRVAYHVGDFAAAETLRHERHRYPVEAETGCAKCQTAEEGYFLHLAGDQAGAVALLEDSLTDHTCSLEYEKARILLPLLLTGDAERARAIHLESIRSLMRSPDLLELLPFELVFCAVTGNAERGLTLLERALETIVPDPLNQDQHFSLAVAIALLLDTLSAEGHGAVRVRGAQNPALAVLWGAELSGEDTRADALAARLWARAKDIATVFDARNGNAFFAHRLDQTRALLGADFPAPIRTTGRYEPVPSALPAETQTPEQARAAAEFLALTGGPDTAVPAIEHALDITRDELPARLFLTSLLISMRRDLGQTDTAATILEARIDELRIAGFIDHAKNEERMGMLQFGAASIEDIALLRSEAEDLRAVGAPASVLAHVLTSLAHVLDREDRLEEARTLAAEAYALATQDPIPYAFHPSLGLHLAILERRLGRDDEALQLLDVLLAEPGTGFVRAHTLFQRATLHAERGETEAALRDGEAFLTQVSGGADRGIEITALDFTAQMLSTLDRDAEAAARTAYAIDLARRAEDDRLVSLHLSLGRYQNWAGAAETAVETLDTAYRMTGEDEPLLDAEILVTLGDAAANAEQFSLAYGAWSQVMDIADHVETPEAAAVGTRAGLSLGALLMRMEDEEAVERLERAAGWARAQDDLGPILETRHRLGLARARFGDPAGVAELEDLRAEIPDGTWLAADVTDSISRALTALDRADEALPYARAAGTAYALAEDPGAAVASGVHEARILVRLDRAEEALERYRTLGDSVPAEAPMHAQVIEEWAQLLESLNRHAEAHALRTREAGR
ncbi:hypothetical protein D9V34_00740 [Mycetocola lacteus]|uniref:Tetratricopeptide repeat protein n=1 Tax=Mycetocola lacteus TaxID=76637 RepID=A0A3L7AL49_9MICO|nr:hypothetical protein [Mycetocola lacteus]RLP80774.1 hypothetical protein D9V34_13035 [Mycetocola lacteus]RLP84559.1 hypothetical protein D9V34_00740 [Mycetocola lacteus]